MRRDVLPLPHLRCGGARKPGSLLGCGRRGNVAGGDTEPRGCDVGRRATVHRPDGGRGVCPAGRRRRSHSLACGPRGPNRSCWPVLAGWLARRTLRQERWDSLAVRLAALFVLVVLTSLLIEAVLAHQLTSPGEAVASRRTRRVPSLPSAVRTARAMGSTVERGVVDWLGGLGLFVMTVEICRAQRRGGRPFVAAADAGCSRVWPHSTCAGSSKSLSGAVETCFPRRWSSTGPCASVRPSPMSMRRAPCLPWSCPRRRRCAWRPGRRIVGALALAALVAGLWLTGSRAAMVGGAVALADTSSWWPAGSGRARKRSWESACSA